MTDEDVGMATPPPNGGTTLTAGPSSTRRMRSILATHSHSHSHAHSHHHHHHHEHEHQHQHVHEDQDDLNFSFSPASPPPYTSTSFTFPPLNDDLTTSTVSPSLFSPHSAASTASIAQSIAHNLGPPSPKALNTPEDVAPMDEDATTTLTATSQIPSSLSQPTKIVIGANNPTASTSGAANGRSTNTHSRTNTTASNVNEDELRRGPPAADTPGGDCKSLCLRHQRMANSGTNLMLQKSIENLPPHDQNAVNTIWSLFSSSPSKRRLLILRGLLTIACPSQLSFLQDHLTLEMRLDPIELLPREVSLKVFSYLDAISLGRAAQVSKTWKDVADDDLLWRTMCEQHIERKCEKCGWGLPLLGERRRKARGMINSLPVTKDGVTLTRRNGDAGVSTPDAGELSSTEESLSSSTPSITTQVQEMAVDSTDYHRSKRAKTQSPGPSRSASPRPSTSMTSSPRSSKPVRPSLPSTSALSAPVVPSTRPWKLVYCERLAIERNWRRGTCVSTVLSGHTDAITCLQVAEDLPHPSFPVLMTGSWDRSVRIWNLETGKEVGVLRGHLRGVRALQFDALKLVTGSMDETLKIWNWRTGECMRTLRGHRGAVICLTYDKQLLVSGSGDSTIRVWDFGTGEVQTLRGHTEWVNSVALYDSNAECGTVTPSSESELGAPTSNPEMARASSKGKYLISGSDDMTIRVWDLYTRQAVRVLTGHVAQVQSIKITVSEEQRAPNFPASTLDSSSSKKKNKGRLISQQDSLEEEEIFDALDESTTNATASTSSCVSTRATNGPGHHSILAPDSTRPQLEPLNLAGDKKPLIVSASLDNTIKIWDVESGLCTRTMFGHIEGVWDVDVDKLRIVSGSHDRTLKIWDRDTGKSLHTLVGHTSAVTAVVLQDQYVITGGDDSQVRIWNFARSKAD